MPLDLRKAVGTFLILAVLSIGVTVQYAAAREDRFPSKPIKLLISGSPGSSSDIPIRALAKAAEKSLGQSITCLNVPGAGGARALSTVVKEKPDGYTLVLMTFPALVTGHMEKFDFSFTDFTPILQVQSHPLPFAVKKDAPWKTWQEFIKYGREHTGTVTVGVFGATSTGWLALKQIENVEKTKFVYVPFPGAGEVMAALLGGHITANTLTSGTLYARNGELKVLLFFSDKRMKDFPDVPTAKEVYGLEGAGINGGFTGIVAPKGLPEPVLARLHDAFKKALDNPEFTKVIGKFELLVSYKNPKEFADVIRKTNEGIKEVLAGVAK
jgi:tripartite-type tricarboxylate transporter receptor subunit TctC